MTKFRHNPNKIRESKLDISLNVVNIVLMLLGVIQVDESVWKKLTREEKQEIERVCDEKLEDYYRRFRPGATG